jgi:hypothetical protein
VIRRFFLAIAILLFSATARADEPRRLAWPKQYPKFHPVEYMATGAMFVASMYIEFGIELTTESKWTGPILFDNSLRVDNKTMRNSAAMNIFSDATLFIPQGIAIALDPAVPLLHGEYETFWQMSMINAEAFGITEILTRWPIKTAGRERPDAYECRTSDPNYGNRCNRGPYASFPSGHTSFAFTGAALTCSHHHSLKLYGSKGADWAACIASMAMATSTALTRTLMDRHWFSDIFVGTMIGLGAGFGVPYLLHYKSPFIKTNEIRATFVPGGVGSGIGGNVLGWF